MANINEVAEWVDGIYQLEEDDPIRGGPNGNDNVQAIALASRTRYLKAAIEQIVLEVITSAMKSSTAQAAAGTDDSTWMTPQKVAHAISTLATISAATETQAGKVELATIAETIAGTDTSRATHPAGVKSAIAQAVAALAGTVPATLDTLAELAAALGNDQNFAATITNALSLKAPVNSPIFTGNPQAPTPAQFDADESLATTEFVQRALGNFRNAYAISAGTSLTAADVGAAITINGGGYVNLPLGSTVKRGSAFLFGSTASGRGISTQGTDTFNLLTLLSSTVVILEQGETFLVVWNGGQWVGISGSFMTKYSSKFSAVLADQGFQKLPSGRIEVNGSFVAPATAGAPISVTFPYGATNCRNIEVTPMSSGTTAISAWYDSPSGTGFNGHCSVPGATVTYRAILD